MDGVSYYKLTEEGIMRKFLLFVSCSIFIISTAIAHEQGGDIQNTIEKGAELVVAQPIMQAPPQVKEGRDYTEAGFIRFYYLGLLAVAQKSNKVCELVGFGEDSICNEMLKTSPSGGKCEGIKDAAVKNFCIAQEENDPSLCPKETDYSENNCKAVVLNDLDICARYTENNLKDALSCANNIYIKRTIADGEASWCEKIQADITAYFICRELANSR